jgi:hypothetical protein
MAKKKIDPIKQKEARQKKFLMIGGGLFIAIMGYQMMTLMSGKKGLPPEAVVATSTIPGAPAPNSLTPPGLPSAPAPVGASNSLADTDAPPVGEATGQLVSFGLFETKNPFAPQVRANSPGASQPPADGATVSASGGTVATRPPTGLSPTGTTPAGATKTPALPGSAGADPSSTTTPTSTTPGAGTTTMATVPSVAVTISVNGRAEKVGKDGTFPAGAPVFRLVSFGRGTAEVGIVGGSYATGGQTLTLDQGKPVTLQNTSDGKRYKLELLATP